MEFRYGDPVHDPTQVKRKSVVYHPVCLACGYDMRGNMSGRCPECGQVFVYGEWEREVRRAKLKVADVESAVASATHAWKVVIAAVGLRLLGLLVAQGGFTAILLRIAVIIAGLVAFALACNVFRVRRLPPWAIEHLTVQPDYGSALVGIVGGIALILSGVFM